MKRIVVICREVWTSIDESEDAEIWEITDEGYKRLGDEYLEPKHLEDNEIIREVSIADYLKETPLGNSLGVKVGTRGCFVPLEDKENV